MKKFISQNWYKLMIASSLMIASFGYLLNSVNTAYANHNHATKLTETKLNTDNQIVSVKLSEKQLDKIIPKNEDGSINIKLSKKQLEELKPNAIQNVNLKQIDGYTPRYRTNLINQAKLVVMTQAD